MKALALSALWFLCGAAWLNPAMLTYVWGYVPRRPYVVVLRNGETVFTSCVDKYHVAPGWVFVDDFVKARQSFGLRADSFGVDYDNPTCDK